MRPSGRMVAYRASTPQDWALFPSWVRSTQSFIPTERNEYRACLGTRLRLTTGSGHQLMHHSAQWSRIQGWAQ
ncbi:hypothetical protein TNCV_4865471 [Trichonephila clavipes]|nr:hypothetical protein TNCV_4865471 [Trichonephila clavipes]